MLADLDIIIVDLQDLGVRCYTYVSTLRYVLEAAAEAGVAVVVADRPIPYPNQVDGPLVASGFESFVAALPVPLVYGMTPAETARFLVKVLDIKLDLRLAPMKHYRRVPDWPHNLQWVRPSPGIRAWSTAWTYPLTVSFEALPAIHYGRGGEDIFKTIGHPDLDATALAVWLNARVLSGVRFIAREPHVLEIQITAPDNCRPARAAVTLLAGLALHLGPDQLWEHGRSAFFDQLWGTAAIRLALHEGKDPSDIADAWAPDLTAFQHIRSTCLIYGADTP